MNKLLELTLWNLQPHDATKSKLAELCDYLIERLADFLQTAIIIKNKSIFSKQYATYFIRSEKPFGGPFQFEWEGNVTLQFLDDDEVYIYSVLRLFSHKDRIGLQKYNGQGIAEMTYGIKDDRKHAEWMFGKWDGDDAGEWEDYSIFESISRSLSK